jgi:hypothetical protein
VVLALWSNALRKAWAKSLRSLKPVGAAIAPIECRTYAGPTSSSRVRPSYLIMAQFLFVFYGLSRLLGLSLPVWVVVALCVGSFFNPFAFVIRAVRPGTQAHRRARSRAC